MSIFASKNLKSWEIFNFSLRSLMLGKKLANLLQVYINLWKSFHRKSDMVFLTNFIER